MLMKKIIKKSIVKIAIAIILCSILSIVVSSFAPHLSNDMAIGQLENDDMSWSLMNVWYQIQNYAYWIYVAIAVITAGSVITDVYKYLKNKKEEI